MALDAVKAIGRLLGTGVDYGVQIVGAPFSATPSAVGEAKRFRPAMALNLADASDDALKAFTGEIDDAAKAFLKRTAPTASSATRFPLFHPIKDFLKKHLFTAIARLKHSGVFGELAKAGGSKFSSQALMNGVKVMGLGGGLLAAGLIAMVGFGTIMAIRGFNDAWYRDEEIGRHHVVGRAHSQIYQKVRMANYGLMGAGVIATFVNPLTGVCLFGLSLANTFLLGNIVEPVLFGVHSLSYPGANPEGNILDRAPFKNWITSAVGRPTPIG